MLILDTNVVSELMRAQPAPEVERWLERQPPAQLALTTVSLAEILYGLDRIPQGRRRSDLSGRFQVFLTRSFGERILPFDRGAAEAYARLKGERDRTGRPLIGYDTMIAAIARVRGASIVTRNVPDFDGGGIAVINPWTAS